MNVIEAIDKYRQENLQASLFQMSADLNVTTEQVREYLDHKEEQLSFDW